MVQSRSKPADGLRVDLVHQTPGRLRIRIPDRRGDRDFFDVVAHVLEACEGVTAVTANPLTGSIVVCHTGPLETIIDHARAFGVSPPPGLPPESSVPAGGKQQTPGRQDRGHPKLGQDDPGAALPANRAPRSTGVTLSQAIAAAFAGFGLVQLAEGNIFAPALSLFWYAAQILETGQARARRYKYAEGDFGAERSFYFRGTDYHLNLRAYNLRLFVEMAAAVDDATWMHHLRSGDYSRWFRDSLGDADLADEVRCIEMQPNPDPVLSRLQIREAIERRYTE